MSGEAPRPGMLDTNILILRRWGEPGLSCRMRWRSARSRWRSCPLARTRCGATGEQDAYDEYAERGPPPGDPAGGPKSEFDPVPFRRRGRGGSTAG